MSFVRNWWFAATLVAAVLMALWLHWPSASAGFRGDDYVQAAMLRGDFPVKRDVLDLFDFASGVPADNAALQDFGYLGWWSAPDLRLRMWRPLASLSMAADYAWFGEHARAQHLHSLLWLAIVVSCATLLFRQLLPKPIAALASVLFAVEEGHAFPAEWLANRSTLIATSFALLACWAHVRMRRHPTPLGGAWVALLAMLALLSGEYSFTGLAYIVSYELFAADGSARARLRASLPAGLAMLAYLGLHSALGRDVVGSGYYVSPFASPVAFAGCAFARAPVLLADLVLGFPASYFNGSSPFRNYALMHHWFSAATWHALPTWPHAHTALGGLALLGYGLVLRQLTRALPAHERGALLCFGIGSLFALLPSAGALPSDRLVVGAAVGVSAVGASVLVSLAPQLAARWPARIGRGLLCAWVVWTLGVNSAVHARRQARAFSHESAALRAWSLDAELPTGGVDDQNPAHQRVYLLAAPDFTTAVNLPWLRRMHGLPLPGAYRRLLPAAQPIDLRRTGERSLEITALTSDLFGDAVPSLYRDAQHPLAAGFRAQLPGLQVTILRAHEGNPALTRFEFDRSLDDPQLWFVNAAASGLRRFQMPAIGETVRMPKAQASDPRGYGRGFYDALPE